MVGFTGDRGKDLPSWWGTGSFCWPSSDRPTSLAALMGWQAPRQSLSPTPCWTLTAWKSEPVRGNSRMDGSSSTFTTSACFSSVSHLFVPSGLSDGGCLDNRLVTTFNEDPVSSRNSVYFNLVSKKKDSIWWNLLPLVINLAALKTPDPFSPPRNWNPEPANSADLRVLLIFQSVVLS